ncbi:MAG: 3-hydroxyacyl-CoA dehydrogenase NAD-binding domain-containing protein [Alphaproteobacteria bacterium]
MTFPDPKSIDRVGVIGAGTIGASWTALFLARGLTVKVFDPDPGGEAMVRDYVANAWDALTKLGQVADGARPDAVSFYTDPAMAAGDVPFIQESVPERIEIKHEVYRQIEPAMAPETILATSSSGLLIKDMQEGLSDPSRLILAHPFNPPHLIPLVELLGNEKTAPAALDWAQSFFEDRCNKQTIRVLKEVPAHVANRLQAALWREAIHLVLEGVATVEDVDKAVVHGPGLRWAVMGPHMLFNLATNGKGMEMFIERFGPSFETWWASMGSPDLTPEAARIIADGCRDEEAGRDFRALAAERDEKLVAILNQSAR